MLTVQFGLPEKQYPFVEGRPYQEVVISILTADGIPCGQGVCTVSSSAYRQSEPLFGKAFTGVVGLDFVPLPEPKPVEPTQVKGKS